MSWWLGMEERKYYYRISDVTGLLEKVDKITGEVLEVRSDRSVALPLIESGFVEQEINGKQVLVQIGLGPVTISPPLAYTEALADLLCERICNGDTVTEACRRLNVRYSDVCRWRRERPEFALAMRQARKDRAEVLADKALNVAEVSDDSQLEVSTLKWLAERNNSEEFGAKTQLQGDPDRPVTFIIDTGVRRVNEDKV